MTLDDGTVLEVKAYWLKKPDKFGSGAVTVEQVPGPCGYKWAIRRGGGECLANDGEWEIEPMPSGRDEEFMERCRFDTIEEAMCAYHKIR